MILMIDADFLVCGMIYYDLPSTSLTLWPPQQQRQWLRSSQLIINNHTFDEENLRKSSRS